jgi:putative membrane protein
MTSSSGILVFVHVAANVVWIGSILAVAVVMASTAADPITRGKIAVDVYRKLAVPAFVVSFVAGTWRLAGSAHYYLVETHFMHPKLFLALAVIGLHHVIGGRARRLASGATAEAGRAAALATVLALCAGGAVLLAVTRPF